ncbi:divergent polysaccharide deacetylase family protein [Desulfonema magnum]|uniref:Divergent polysaccharide deacetylase n=1 Tax=Desulfonema magnum TaxID=45655 RepID=A0A975BWA9_9BACT|nr:divergent polysaccharide deacetylase family protein [Desulfonema magnum]QTA92931.1 Divergent polysaccharide deacetylase [Desulfonema magnum]
MAEKKEGTEKKPVLRTCFKRFVPGLPLLLLLAVLLGYISHCSFYAKKEPLAHNTPTFEIYPKEAVVPRTRIPKPGPLLPKVAIIIDDMGYDSVIAKKFIDLDAAITFSIFPYSPFQKKIIRMARAKGNDIMLHLPMEPMEYPVVDPGPGALLTSMSPEQIVSQLEKNLNTVPFIKGVNNHMGSRMTTVSNQMYQILSVLKKRGLFFIDSFTTMDSICKSSARLLQVPFAQRDVFLDHIQHPDVIRRQIKHLIRVANNYGEAVGIGHPHMVTYQILHEMLPLLRKKVRLVPASEVVHTIG